MNVVTDFIVVHLGFIIGALLAALIVTQVLRRRTSPAATVAWLLAIILFPYVGVPLYLLFSARKTKRARASKPRLSLPDNDVLPGAQAHRLDVMLRNYGLPGATVGNTFKLVGTGEQGYEELVRMIEEAEESLFLSTFLFRSDEVGKDILKRLVRRASQGLKVRLLLDAVGSFSISRWHLSPLVKAGGRAAFFRPLIHLPLGGRTNLRNHRKILVADEKRVMAGGANIAREYIGPGLDRERWRDLSFTLEGPAVRAYAEIFRSDWQYATGERLELDSEYRQRLIDPQDGSVVQVIPSGPDVEGDPLYDAILASVFSAQRRFWAVTPYFVPDDAMVQALTIAAHRGVDVRIVLPKKSNHRLADLARATSLRQIRAAGGRIMLYPGGMVHAKAVLVDDELAIIGSANLDMRSLFLNHEVMIFAYSRPEIESTRAWIDDLSSFARRFDEKVGALREIGEGLVRMLSPLL